MRASTFPIVGLALFLLATGGCAKFQDANPWVDWSTPADAISTPSADGVYAYNRTPATRQRKWDRTAGYYENEAVTHWPLWWEDPFEDKGSEDGQFAWTYEDYVAMPYGLARFLLNTMAFPVSATVTPSFTVMASDGQLSKQLLGYDHDAEPYRPGSQSATAQQTNAVIQSEQTPESQQAPAQN